MIFYSLFRRGRTAIGRGILFGILLSIGAETAPAQTFRWVTMAGGAYMGISHGLYTDPAGNCYLTGAFGNRATLDSIDLSGTVFQHLFIARYSPSGRITWGHIAGTITESGYFGPHAIAADDAGNSYITGDFSGTVLFGDSSVTSRGGGDFFLAKYGPAGDFLWVRTGGGPSNDDSGHDIAVDAEGNAYVTGYIQGSVVFDTTSLSARGYDVLLAKYSSAGELQWARRIGGFNRDIGYGIDVDDGGNAYITGVFSSTVAFGGASLASRGTSDIFVARCNSRGEIEWGARAGGSGADEGQDIAVDAAGNCYMTGYITGRGIFGTDTAGEGAARNLAVAAYSPSGELRWVRASQGSSASGRGIAANSAGDICVAGEFIGTVNIEGVSLVSSGGTDICVARLDASGRLVWGAKAGGVQDGPDDQDLCYSTGIDAAGNGYLLGSCTGRTTFGDITIPSLTPNNLFVAGIAGSPAAVIQGDRDGYDIRMIGRESLAIRSTGGGVAPVQVVIRNTLGVVVYQGTAGDVIDLSALPSGPYFLAIQDTGAPVRVKLAVTR